jgi:hypothetical protein
MSNSLVDCSKVYIKNIEKNGESMSGAFTNQTINKGDIVESGLIRIVNLDGHNNPYVFTWSDNIPNTTWGIGSGCATFYNTSLNPNTIMERNFSNNSFIIRSLRDIEKDEELTHMYKSLKWRKCFSKINDYLEKN